MLATILKMSIILSLKNIKNKFIDLENLFKHVLHIEILHNPRYVYYFIF